MQKEVAILLALMPIRALADVGIPSINDLPIIYGMVGQNQTYKDASYKTQEALFIKLGITDACKSQGAVKKEYTQRFRNPFVGRVMHTLTLTTKSIQTGVEIPF